MNNFEKCHLKSFIRRSAAGKGTRAHLVQLYEVVLKVLEIPLEGLGDLLPVLQRTPLYTAAIFQVPQLALDPLLRLEVGETCQGEGRTCWTLGRTPQKSTVC